MDGFLPIVVTAELLISEFSLPLVVCVLIRRKCRGISVFTFCGKEDCLVGFAHFSMLFFGTPG